MAFALPVRFAHVLALGTTLAMLSTCDRSSSGSSAPTTPAADEASNSTTAATKGWHYTVTPDPKLETIHVRMCFAGSPTALFIPGDQSAKEHIRDLRMVDGEPLVVKERGYSLDPVPDDGCVEYTVDLDSLEQGKGTRRTVGRTGNSVMVRPRAWLWRPDILPGGVDVTMRFALPPGMELSVPWPTRGPGAPGTSEATYVLPRTAFYWLSYTVFGDLTIDRFERAGADVELVRLDAPVVCPPEGLRRWVIDAVDTVAMLFEGHFPRDHVQLVVLPVEGDGSGTVYFGMAGRGGGAGVFIFLDDHAKADALPGGWTTVHELLHHGMPFIDEPWMAEGWVSYYTELMRTRQGHRTEQQGWEALVKAFDRGRRRSTDETLARSSETMHSSHAYQRVYWGGAAVALLIDVQMRIESNGARSLDHAMRQLRACCGEASHLWAAEDLLEQLDTWYGRPLFSETAAAVLEQTEFPDIEATLSRLGVSVHDGEVRLDDQAPTAAIRRAMMAPRREPAPSG